MKFIDRTLDELANIICGNDEFSNHFTYRSSSFLTKFFSENGLDFKHDGSTRQWWVKDRLKEILNGPQQDEQTPPVEFLKVIDSLMDLRDAKDGDPKRIEALKQLNTTLSREGFEAYYADDKHCYLRHTGNNRSIGLPINPSRPLTKQEQEKKNFLTRYLNRISEDELIEEVLLPLFGQLGFYRITAAGHKDKALEYGKDVWMKFKLPTQHYLYFGIQAKKGKVDAAGVSKGSNANIAEIYNQLLMMLGHEIFDPETSRKVLVDHAFIVTAGDITKAARNWLGDKLDNTKRSQVMFLDRNDILNLYVVMNIPLPPTALPPEINMEDEIPF